MKCRHWLFLFVLFSLTLFLAGFRLGKKIERIDKTYTPPPSLIKTQTPTATPKPLDFYTFLSSDCGVKFLYPSFFSEENTATNEARLIFQKEEIIISCQKKQIEEFKKTKIKLKQEGETKINSQPIILYQSPKENYLLFTLFNPKNSKTILITTPKNLINLISETLEFL